MIRDSADQWKTAESLELWVHDNYYKTCSIKIFCTFIQTSWWRQIRDRAIFWILLWVYYILGLCVGNKYSWVNYISWSTSSDLYNCRSLKNFLREEVLCSVGYFVFINKFIGLTSQNPAYQYYSSFLLVWSYYLLSFSPWWYRDQRCYPAFVLECSYDYCFLNTCACHLFYFFHL